MALFGLLGRKRHERAGFALYTEAVRAARSPYFYAELGVPDTMDGRFDMIGLYVCLLIDRLRGAEEPGPALAQAVFDAMFLDMDGVLRELGVGDMGVGRRVKAMWEALHGRSDAYSAALERGDAAALADALSRNVWRGASAGQGPQVLASLALRERAHLATEPLASLLQGKVAFGTADRVAA